MRPIFDNFGLDCAAENWAKRAVIALRHASRRVSRIWLERTLPDHFVDNVGVFTYATHLEAIQNNRPLVADAREK
jgi:hypothetical protein